MLVTEATLNNNQTCYLTAGARMSAPQASSGKAFKLNLFKRYLNCFRVYSNVFCRGFVALNASIMLVFKHHNIMEVSSRCCSQFILVNGTWRWLFTGCRMHKCFSAGHEKEVIRVMKRELKDFS